MDLFKMTNNARIEKHTFFQVRQHLIWTSHRVFFYYSCVISVGADIDRDFCFLVNTVEN